MSKPIVFVVDDQAFICDTVAAILKNTYEVRTFTSGKDAIAYMTDNKADVLLLDYEMPGMTGYEVLMGMRNTINLDTPVIFLTAETNERMKIEMMERGASDYICKPINSALLTQGIQKQLGK